MKQKTVDEIIQDHKSNINTHRVLNQITTESIEIALFWSKDLITLPDEATDFDYLINNTIIDYDELFGLLNTNNQSLIPKVVGLLRVGVLNLDGTLHNNMAYSVDKVSRAKLKAIE